MVVAPGSGHVGSERMPAAAQLPHLLLQRRHDGVTLSPEPGVQEAVLNKRQRPDLVGLERAPQPAVVVDPPEVGEKRAHCLAVALAARGESLLTHPV